MNQTYIPSANRIPSQANPKEPLGRVPRQRRKKKTKSDDNRQGPNCSKSKADKRYSYLYNYQISLLVVPSLFFLFNFNHGGYNSNNILLILSIYCTLIVYILDLANWKDGYYCGPSLCFCVIAAFLCWDHIVHYDRHTFHWSCTSTMIDYERSMMIGGNDEGVQRKLESWGVFFLSLWDLITKIIFFYCLSCWSLLQCKWLPQQELHETETTLHFFLPISFSSIVSFSMLQYLNIDCETLPQEDDSINVWSLVPIVFSFSFSWSVKLLCNLKSSFYEEVSLSSNSSTTKNNEDKRNDMENIASLRERRMQQLENNQRKDIFYKYAHTISSSHGDYLSYIGFIVPSLICTLSHHIKQNHHILKLNISSSTSTTNTRLALNIIFDYALAITLPFLLHSFYLNYGLWWRSTLHENFNFDKWKKKVKVVEFLSFFISVEIGIHQYLIDAFTYIAQHLHPSDDKVESKSYSRLVMFMLINGGIIFLAAYNHQFSTASLNCPARTSSIHSRNVYSLAIVLASSLCFGLCLSLTWNSMLYFTSTLLSLSLYQSSQKIQFFVLSIFNLIMTISSLLLTTQTFSTSSARIINMCYILFFIIINTHTLIATSKVNHIDSQRFRTSVNFNWMFGFFSTSHFIIEILLMEDLKEINMSFTVKLSSLIFLGIGILLHKWNLLSPKAHLVSTSLSMGKLTVSVVETNLDNDGISGKWQILGHSIITTLTLITIGWPFLPSNIFKSDTKVHQFNKKRIPLGKAEKRKIAIYCGVILPILIVHFTSTLTYLIEVLMGVHSHTQRTDIFLRFEVWSHSFLLWGAIVTLVLHRNLPDGGAEKWKRLALGSFLFGLLVCFVGPSIFMLSRRSSGSETTNTSSLHFSAIQAPKKAQTHPRVGFSGMLVTVIVLLRLTLSKRFSTNYEASINLYGGKSEVILLGFIFLLLNRIAGIRISLYIFSCAVFGVLLHIGNFVKQKEYSCLSLALITSFGLGYTTNVKIKNSSLALLLWGISCLSIATMGRFLRKRRKIESRSFTNIAILSSWFALTAAIYLEFGIASIGVESEYSYIFGYPVSTTMTIPLALILFMLEGESNSKHKTLYMMLGNLSHRQWFRYPFQVTAVTLGLTTFYALILRGVVHYLTNYQVHDPYESIFQSNFGHESRTTHHFDINPSMRKYSFHQQTIEIASKLTACGLWTSKTSFGFTKHLIGSIITFYSWYSLIKCTNAVDVSNLLYNRLLLHLFPMFFCHGISSLSIGCYMWLLLAFLESFMLKLE